MSTVIQIDPQRRSDLARELERLAARLPQARREHLSAAMMIGYGVAMGWFREEEGTGEGRS